MPVIKRESPEITIGYNPKGAGNKPVFTVISVIDSTTFLPGDILSLKTVDALVAGIDNFRIEFDKVTIVLEK